MFRPPEHNIKVETWTRSASYPSAVSPTLYEASGRNLLMENIQEKSLKRISTWSEQGSSTSAACRTRQCRGWQWLARPQNYLPNLDLCQHHCNIHCIVCKIAERAKIKMVTSVHIEHKVPVRPPSWPVVQVLDDVVCVFLASLPRTKKNLIIIF